MSSMLKRSIACMTVSLTSLSHADDIYIYAAASLTNVVAELAQRYEKQQPQHKIIPVFGASSSLAKQIYAGAQSDLFFSADVDWMNDLVAKSKIQANQVKPLLRNDLVLISPKNLNIQITMKPQFKLSQAFSGYLCTGQMESVPVGKYAKQSLIQLNWYQTLTGRIVGADDVRAALAFVERGECQLGIVYKTDALISQKVKIVGTFPAASHHPIIYPLAMTQQGMQRRSVQHFQQFLTQSKDAKQVYQAYGFRVNP